MPDTYRTFFGLQSEPFCSDLRVKDIMPTAELQSVVNKITYAVKLGSAAIVTGEIGSGKSTAVRFAAEAFHPSAYKIIYITATSGTIMELYRQIVSELGFHRSSNSKAVMTGLIKKEIQALVEDKKMKVVLIVDEASLLRIEVLAELHTLCQFHKDAGPYLPMVLVGQSQLIDKLSYRASAALASRVVARSHLEGINREDMSLYLQHHLSLAGIKSALFDEAAVTAVHQGANGLLRKANHLARGALIAAAKAESQTVTADHVRLASTELF